MCLLHKPKKPDAVKPWYQFWKKKSSLLPHRRQDKSYVDVGFKTRKGTQRKVRNEAIKVVFDKPMVLMTTTRNAKPRHLGLARCEQRVDVDLEQPV